MVHEPVDRTETSSIPPAALAKLMTLLGYFGFGIAVGVGVQGGPIATQVLVAVASSMLVFNGFRWALRLRNEQEQMHELRRWTCASKKHKCQDPLPHAHREDIPPLSEDDDGGSVVYV